MYLFLWKNVFFDIGSHYFPLKVARFEYVKTFRSKYNVQFVVLKRFYRKITGLMAAIRFLSEIGLFTGGCSN